MISDKTNQADNVAGSFQRIDSLSVCNVDCWYSVYRYDDIIHSAQHRQLHINNIMQCIMILRLQKNRPLNKYTN